MRFLIIALSSICFLAHCGNNADMPNIVGTSSANDKRAESLFQEARSYEENGQTKRAIKNYKKIANDIPLAKRAPEARFRQAQLVDQSGDPLKAFDLYQQVIAADYRSQFYDQALNRQFEIAIAAAEGDLKNSFLGLDSNVSDSDLIEMLGKCIANAPRSSIAAKSALMIGNLYAAKGDVERAVSAFRRVVEDHPSSPQAPEAQFRIGEILLKQARTGNQDQANLNRAREGFADYLSQFPNHKRNDEAKRLLNSIQSRDIQNTFDIAQFYENKGQLSSAKFYYQEVVRRTKSGDLHDRAAARLAALENDE